MRERRAGGMNNLAAVRAFYLDVAPWAMEERSRWGPQAAPCPIHAEDLTRQKDIRSRKSRMDQPTRERLPLLPMMVQHVATRRAEAATMLREAELIAPGATSTVAEPEWRRCVVGKDSARVWVVVENPTGEGKRGDLTGEDGQTLPGGCRFE